MAENNDIFNGTYKNYLKSLTKEELIDEIYNKHNITFRNDTKHVLSDKIFKGIRKVALKISYNGQCYSGVQENEGLTISEVLINALKATNLFLYSNDNNNIEFCGRTDKGVNASNMIVTLFVKSRFEEKISRKYEIDEYVFNGKKYFKTIYTKEDFEVSEEDKKEIPYDIVLNNILPEEIKVKGWAPVPHNFSARHHCRERHYKYFFVDKTNLFSSYTKTSEIISKKNNFYDLSKHTKENAVYDFKLKEMKFEMIKNIDDTHSLYVMDIKSYFFLHNMVRKIMFWCKRYVHEGITHFKEVQCAKGENLLFYGATYDFDLNFIAKPSYKINLKKDEYAHDILSEIIKYL